MIRAWISHYPLEVVHAQQKGGCNENPACVLHGLAHISARSRRLAGIGRAASATQWIGWDPIAKRVRSWIFDAAGGFGEGSWTGDGNKWVIKTNSILQDGKKGAATYIVTRVDADTISLQAKDRSVEGKGIPDTPEVRLKRVK